MTHFRQSTQHQLPAYQYAYGNKTASGVCLQNVTDYSPFGVPLDGRTMQGDGYRYSFQGQEHDDEVKGEGNSVNYKYRMHDPRVGRFFAVDPIYGIYPMLSPYQFASNSPVYAIEMEGLQAWVVTWASQSSDKHGDQQIGHTGIVVKNYIEVKEKVMKSSLKYNHIKGGYDVIVWEEVVTTYEPTGSYTYYDFWPEGATLSGKEAINDVTSETTSQAFHFVLDGIVIKDDAELEKWLKSHDASQIEDILAGLPEQKRNSGATGTSEGRPSDGILKLELSPKESFNLKKEYQSIISQSKKYNGISNNCTSFICEGINNIGMEIKEESIWDWRNFLINEWVTYTFTPNETYKQLSQKSNVTIIKNANNETKENYEEAILDN